MQLFRKKTRRELILFAVLNGVIGEGGKKMTEQEIIDQYSTVVRVLALARTQRTCDTDDVYSVYPIMVIPSIIPPLARKLPCRKAVFFVNHS